MRLQAVDEYPFHQHPAPFNMPSTTDSHFNDGYWFAFYAEDWYCLTGLRLHPNVNAMDGFAAVVQGGRQHCLRASRALRPAADLLSVGPLSIEVIEGLKRVRFVVGENPIGLGLDVVFEGLASPYTEDRYVHVKYGAVVNDTLRYTQVCRVSGTATFAGDTHGIDRWHGIRDHSWGVRSSMGPPIRIGGTERAEGEEDNRALRLWVPFEASDHVGFFQTHEDADGRTIDFEGRLHYEDGRIVVLDSVRHALEYAPGTTIPVGGSLELHGTDGLTRAYTLRASGPGADVHGIGYYRGWHDGGSAGVYRGPEHLETDVYEVTTERQGPPHVPEARRMGATEFPCFMSDAGGEGMAHVEHHIFGTYKPYGF